LCLEPLSSCVPAIFSVMDDFSTFAENQLPVNASGFS
jgi:hypothetical protein